MLIVSLVFIVQSYEVAIFSSDSAVVPAISSQISKLSPTSKISIIRSPVDLLKNPDLLILCDDDLVLNQVYIEKSQQFNIPTLVNDYGVDQNSVFYVKGSRSCLSETIKALIASFSFKKLGLVWHFTNTNSLIVEEVHSSALYKLMHVSFSEDSSKIVAYSLLSNLFKAEGYQYYLFLSHNKSCSDISLALKNTYLEKEGNAAVFIDECIYLNNINGSITLVRHGVENPNNFTEYIQAVFSPFLSALSDSSLSSYQLQDSFRKANSYCNYSIINKVNGTNAFIGSVIDLKVSIYKAPVFFKDIVNLSSYPKSVFTISANTGTFNPLGNAPTYVNQQYNQGTYFAVSKINREKELLPAYDLSLYDQVDCGVSVFDLNFSKQCFTNRTKLMGYTYIPTLSSITSSVLQLFYTLKFNIPVIGGVGTAGSLSNKVKYPTFVRMVSPSSYFGSAWSNLFGLFNWSNVVIHYTNDSFGQSVYNIINSSTSKGYQILNNEKYHLINPILSQSSIADYYPYMQDSINTGCNIVLLAMSDPSPFFWLEGLYDLGVRRGDYLFILFTNTGLDNFNSLNANLTKRYELMHGSFTIYNAAWVGEYGQLVKTELLNYYNRSWGRSYYIDAVYSSVHTAKYLLDRGLPFENYTVFMNALRKIRFLGCTGSISFDSSSNDRNLYYFNLYNFYQDSNGNWHDDAIGFIAPLGSVYFTLVQNPVWPGGVVPTDIKLNYSNCPFREAQIISSTKGIAIKVALSFSLLIISVILTVYSVRKIRYTNIHILNAKVYAVFEDYLTLGFILVENMQIISIGPSFLSFNTFLSNISELLSINLSKATRYRDGTFWIIFYSMLCIGYSWLLLLFLDFLSNFSLFRKMKNITVPLKSNSSSVMTNYLFLPILVSAFSIFVCDKAIGQDLANSYLNYDCNQFCWTGKHLILILFSSLIIVIYIPFAILHRTLWQEENRLMNIRANTLFLIIKNVLVVILVILGKILKENYRLIHGVIFISVYMCYSGIILYIKNLFNYDRANLWTKVMSFCVFWNTLVCIFDGSLGYSSYISLIIQILGWATIVIIGLILQYRLPENMIITKKGRSIVDLFKFAFGMKSYQKSRYIDDEENDLELFQDN